MKIQSRFCLLLLRAIVLASPLACAKAGDATELRDSPQAGLQTRGLKASGRRHAVTNQPIQVPARHPGSVLIFPVYTSSIAAPHQQNTRFSLTNVAEAASVNVHLFFVDGASGATIDTWICLTANQTVSLLASHVDPGVNGYVVAVATDGRGCPLNFNFLVGEANVKFASGHAANLAAEALAKLDDAPVCETAAAKAELRFDGRSYNALPRVLALSNFPSRADGNETFVLVDRIGGDLTSVAAPVGTLFGVLFDDAGIPFSLSRGVNAPQLRINLRSQFPFQPRLEWIIPAGRSGWLKLFHFTQDIALLGAVFNFNPYGETNSFSQSHNLHALSLTNSAVLTIPVFPPAC